MRTDRVYARISTALGEAGLRAVGRLNVPLYRASRGLLFSRVGGNPVLLLTTTGRRSGTPRTAPLLYMRDDDRFVVIGSNAGNESTPAWALNLEADTRAEIELGGKRVSVQARIAEGQERAELWHRMSERYRGFDDYDARTSRQIAVFVLEPSSAPSKP
jgi:F420H(2)-dependent quinone reductase